MPKISLYDFQTNPANESVDSIFLNFSLQSRTYPGFCKVFLLKPTKVRPTFQITWSSPFEEDSTLELSISAAMKALRLQDGKTGILSVMGRESYGSTDAVSPASSCVILRSREVACYPLGFWEIGMEAQDLVLSSILGAVSNRN